MIDIRVQVKDIQVGDLHVGRGSKVVEIKPLPAGHRVQGPRGGKYATRYAGDFYVMVLANGQRPVAPFNATITVARDEA